MSPFLYGKFIMKIKRIDKARNKTCYYKFDINFFMVKDIPNNMYCY